MPAPPEIPLPIDFLGIQAFLAIAETGSFSLAAARLHLSQTAISHRMRKLEESLGVDLLVRTTRGVSLTQAGEALLPRARAAVQQLDASLDTVRRHREEAIRWVSIGCIPTVAAGILVPLLRAAAQAHAGLPVRVFDSSPLEILELVQAGTAAFGITLPQPASATVTLQPIAEEDFVLACPAGHRFAGREDLAWSELETEPLVRISLPSGNSMTIDESVGALRERLHWRYEAQRTAIALEMVRGGLGLTLVPRLAVRPATGIVTVPLRSPEVRRTLALVTPAGQALAGPERWLADTAATLIRQELAAGR